MKGKTKMTDDEKFAAFKVQAINRKEKLYGNELRAKYGEETLSTSAKKFNSLSKDEMKHAANLTQQILRELKSLIDTDDVKQVAAKHLFDLHQEYLIMIWPKGQYSPAVQQNHAAMYEPVCKII